jgi:thiol-disulfide isomerase/thioredoxin
LYLNNTLNAGLKSLEDYKKRNEIIKLKFSGLTRDYLLSTNYLNFFKLNNKINEFIKSDYSNVCSSLSFKNKVFGITEKTSQIISSDNLDNLFSYKYNSYFKIKNIIDSKKGKLILIDNWASWCRPCRAEMEASLKLYSNLDPSKISFVYLSEDSDNDSWQKAIKQDNLTEMENYKYADISASSFIKQFNITTIPRYILIGKDGKVISADAPRPSDPKLKALIDKYINQ